MTKLKLLKEEDRFPMNMGKICYLYHDLSLKKMNTFVACVIDYSISVVGIGFMCN